MTYERKTLVTRGEAEIYGLIRETISHGRPAKCRICLMPLKVGEVCVSIKLYHGHAHFDCLKLLMQKVEFPDTWLSMLMEGTE